MIYSRFLLTLIFLFHSFIGSAQAKKSNPLTGIWRILAYEDLDSATGQWVYAYGRHPLGYISYSETGVVMVNFCTDTALKLTEDAAKNYPVMLQDFNYHYAFGYFGTYTIDVKNAEVVHHVTGGSMPWYVGTDQVRIFHIRGDTLIIGNNITERRVFVRVK